MSTYKLKITGMTCGSCVGTVDNALSSCKAQIREQEKKSEQELPILVEVSLPGSARITLDSKLPHEQLMEIFKKAVTEVGFSAEEDLPPINQAATITNTAVTETRQALPQPVAASQRKKVRQYLWKSVAGIVSGALIMGLCLSGIGLPFAIQLLLAASGTALTIFLGKEIYAKAALNIKNVFKRKEKSLSMNVLLSISSLIALGISICALFLPGLPMMFDTALLIFGFSHLGSALKTSESEKAAQQLNFCALPSPIVVKISAEGEQKLEITQIKRGDLIRIYTGQTIPLDGHCQSEGAAVCDIIDTGKNAARTVKRGEYLKGGWEVPQGLAYIDILVDKEVAESTLALRNERYRLARAAKNKARERPPFERLANLMAHYFIPGILTIAIVSAVIIGTLFSPLNALQAAAFIMACACPCTLGLIIPLIIKLAIAYAAKEGLLIQSEEGFQFLSETDTVIFDWSGTLTTGVPQVVHIDGNLSTEHLAYLAALEGQSNHHVAAAICEHLRKEKNLSTELTVSAVQAHHFGLMAYIAPQASALPGLEEKAGTYLTGNKEYLNSLGIDLTAYEEAVKLEEQKSQHQAQQVTYFARRTGEGSYEVLGHILLRDSLRPDAAEVIQKLKRQGIQVGIWSGSSDENLAQFARESKVDYYAANCLSTSETAGEESKTAPAVNTKHHLMAGLRKQGRKSIMVGDSGNDIFAMAESDFAIAVQSKNAHSLTQQSADAILDPQGRDKPLHAILNALTLAKNSVSSIKTNLAINLLYNFFSSALFTVLLFGLGITLNPAIGAGLMVLQAGLLFWNLHRMVKKKPVCSNDSSMPPPGGNIYELAPQLKPRPAPQCAHSPRAVKGYAMNSQYSPRVFTGQGCAQPSPHTKATPQQQQETVYKP